MLLAVAGVWFFGFAPVMEVEGTKVSTGEFMRVESAITQYNKATHSGAASSMPAEVKKQAFMNITDRILLENLVMPTDPSISQRAPELVREAIASKPELSIAEAAERIYGLTEGEFSEIVLIPQAKRNLLAEHFKNDPNKLNDAWENIVSTANVKIYYPGFYWENGEVKVK